MLSLFDLHCDTAHELYRQNLPLCNNDLHIDLDRLSRYDKAVQVFAVWTPKDLSGAARFDNACRVIENFIGEIQKNADRIALCVNYDQIVAAHAQGKVAAILGIEGGGAFDGKLDNIDVLHAFGVRIVTVTWNGPNELACGVPDEGGLTDFGRAALDRMADLGMIVDLSHANRQSFEEITAYYQGPLMASHSNAFEVCDHRRNLLPQARKKLGLIGINLYPPFVGEDILPHISAMCECPLALGCDFDGVDALPDGVSGVQDLPKLHARIAQTFGLTYANNVFFNNAMEFMKNYLR
jgi:membrane dipeptidase